MSDAILSALAIVIVLGGLAAGITLCVVVLRRGEAQIKRFGRAIRRPARGSSITADEMIDLHLALKDVSSLREIADRITA
jgi:hypothetical protein